jgi:hypothetical protein
MLTKEDNIEILAEEDIEALYSFLSLEWDSMDNATKETWEKLLTEIENKIDLQNEKNNNLQRL